MVFVRTISLKRGNGGVNRTSECLDVGVKETKVLWIEPKFEV